VTRDAAGAKVRHTVDRQVKAWWFAQGAGAAVFVQAKYGTKVIALSGAGNSVQVATVGDVAAVLAAIKDAHHHDAGTIMILNRRFCCVRCGWSVGI